MTLSARESRGRSCHRLSLFASRDLKLDVMKRRRSGSGIVISDDLCFDVVQTLSRLKTLSTVTKSWSWNGKLFALLPNGTIVKVRFAETLDEAILNTMAIANSSIAHMKLIILLLDWCTDNCVCFVSVDTRVHVFRLCHHYNYV